MVTEDGKDIGMNIARKSIPFQKMVLRGGQN